MKSRNTQQNYYLFYLFSVVGTLLASAYPLYMGAKVVVDMLRNGTVRAEDYPKYVIPYTPVSLAILFGVVLMPLFLRCAKRFALPAASLLSVGLFFLTELLLENAVIVTESGWSSLESWQMFSCYIPPDLFATRTWTPVDVLIGEYSPAFKLHFYLIALVLILAFLNVFYGFARMIREGDRRRLRPLLLQAVSSVVFLGLCIFACFTAFFRDGELTVSLVSAVLMMVFFTALGVTVGLYTGSFLFGKKPGLSVWLPSAVSSVVVLAMYIGEMFLLSGHLYRFGAGFFFEGLGFLVLAPVDLVVILLSGGICALILMTAAGKEERKKKKPAFWITAAAVTAGIVITAAWLLAGQNRIIRDADRLNMVDDIIGNADSSAALSSNANEYIRESADIYDKLVQGGQSTVDCFVRELREAEHYGLREYIMAAVCAEITGIGNGEDAAAEWSSAGEWLVLYDGAAFPYPSPAPSSSITTPESTVSPMLAGKPFMVYSYADSADPMRPAIFLSADNNSFQFTYSVLSSYIAVGEYTLSDTTLTLKTDDGLNVYVFAVDDDGAYRFDAERSSPIPSYVYSAGAAPQSPVPDGARFTSG